MASLVREGVLSLRLEKRGGGLALLLCACGILFASAQSRAASFAEDFATNPFAKGWSQFGNTNLFHWNSTNQNLEVTWDSAQPNSYFYRPLGTILTAQDDFSVAFDITLLDEVNSNDFEICVGLLNTVNAFSPGFFRADGVHASNLVEFAYFPAFSFFQPTFSVVTVSTNGAWLYNHDNLLEMTLGEVFHIEMNYASATRTLTTVITNNGFQYGVTQTITLPANYDIRSPSISVSSYSHQKAFGRILAHGVVDNVAVSTPPPPVEGLSGAFQGSEWQAQFLSRSNWVYTLQRSVNATAWTSLVSTTAQGGLVLMADTNAQAQHAWYRVQAARP
jgi:hypothetical protein